MLRQLPIPAFVLDLIALVFGNCVVCFGEYWFQQHDIGIPMGIEPALDVVSWPWPTSRTTAACLTASVNRLGDIRPLNQRAHGASGRATRSCTSS